MNNHDEYEILSEDVIEMFDGKEIDDMADLKVYEYGFLTKEQKEEMKVGDSAKIVAEIKPHEKVYKGTVSKTFRGGLELMDGNKYWYDFNNRSIDKFIREWGSESVGWIGKMIEIEAKENFGKGYAIFWKPQQEE